MRTQKTFDPPPPFWGSSPEDWYSFCERVENQRLESLSTPSEPLGVKMPPHLRNNVKYAEGGKPDYARFVAIIKYINGAPGGYSVYPSWEVINFGSNEQQGLEDLINRVIKSIPPADLREAKIFMNLSLNLRTDSKMYNYPVACYKPVYSKKNGLEIKNVWGKKTLQFAYIGGTYKVAVNETLTLQRMAGHKLYLNH
jgi:hypothetical protein